MCSNRERGWTIIELMVIIIVIAVLAIGAIIIFGNMIDRSRESATKGSLGALRSAISTYYADKEGLWPDDLEIVNATSFNGNYIDEIPVAKLRKALPETNNVRHETTANSNGGWLYNSDTGSITVNHDGKDTHGVYYSTY